MTEQVTSRVDPFGLWEPAVTIPIGLDEMAQVSFGISGPEDAAFQESTEPVALWRICSLEELEARAQKVHAIESGLSQAESRAASFLTAQGGKGQPAGQLDDRGNVSFDLRDTSPILPNTPEGKLFMNLASASGNLAADESMVSYGLLDQLSTGPNWGELQGHFNQLMDSVNRQLFHFAWVDTVMEGTFLARTTINWGGDMVNVWTQGIRPEQVHLHHRSLALAVQSRHNSLRTITTVARIASGLALAFATPLGAARLMALSWEFINEVLVPFLETGSE